jgi:hypothetical protein
MSDENVNCLFQMAKGREKKYLSLRLNLEKTLKKRHKNKMSKAFLNALTKGYKG